MIRAFLGLVLVFSFADAKMFQSVSVSKGEFIQKGQIKYSCPNCGMHLPMFYKTNHVHQDHQYCSLHCLVEATEQKMPDDAKVVDVKSLKFIPAKKAFYVLGSKKPATMSVKSKYAFKDELDAKKFAKRYKGKIVSFKEAYDTARMDFGKDAKMIQTKREKKVYKAGKKIYEKKCPKIDVSAFENIAFLKAHIKQKCKISSPKGLQMTAVYLWDTKRLHKKLQKTDQIAVPKDAKCPVCGMFVAKYPKWVGLVEDGDKKYYFDGVKDMIKFLKSKKKRYENIYVTDYFTTNKLGARHAYYVVGSNIYGPMGKELIPFKSEAKALEFKEDHFGGMVLRFHEIDKEVMEDL